MCAPRTAPPCALPGADQTHAPDAHLLNGGDVVHAQALERVLKSLVVRGGSFVDGLLLPPDRALATRAHLRSHFGEFLRVHLSLRLSRGHASVKHGTNKDARPSHRDSWQMPQPRTRPGSCHGVAPSPCGVLAPAPLGARVGASRHCNPRQRSTRPRPENRNSRLSRTKKQFPWVFL